MEIVGKLPHRIQFPGVLTDFLKKTERTDGLIQWNPGSRDEKINAHMIRIVSPSASPQHFAHFISSAPASPQRGKA